MAKQAKEKTHGQEDLANAIFAASTLEPIVIEESESAKPFKLVYYCSHFGLLGLSF
jgi:hypothetical protein